MVLFWSFRIVFTLSYLFFVLIVSQVRFRLFRWFRFARFGGFVSLFRVLVHASRLHLACQVERRGLVLNEIAEIGKKNRKSVTSGSFKALCMRLPFARNESLTEFDVGRSPNYPCGGGEWQLLLQIK